MTRLIIAALLSSACATRPSPVEVPNLDIPQDLAVTAPLGETTILAVPITNRGTAQATVRIEVAGDISSPSAVVIDAGQMRTLRISISPTAPEPTAASMRFTTDYESTSRTIDITALVDVDADGDASLAAGGTDCDDRNPNVFVGAVERCNGVDDDCDGNIDGNATDEQTFFEDADGDGWGVTGTTTQRCSIPAGFSLQAGDCNDQDSSVNPGSTEQFYDGVDQDCSGSSDFDADSDGFDAAAFGGLDCRDTDGSSFPGAAERLGDGLDQDCDGAVDERAPTVGELSITEVHPEPLNGPVFVELVSHTAAVLSLDGVGLVSGAAIVLPDESNLLPFSTFVLCNAQAEFCDATLSLLTLNGVEELRLGVPLLDSVPLELLPYNTGASAQWPQAADPIANDDPEAWCRAISPQPTATPGDAFASCGL